MKEARIESLKHEQANRPRWSGLSLEIGDVTLVWDDGKQVKAHKDKLCRGSADSERECLAFTNYKKNESYEKEQV